MTLLIIGVIVATAIALTASGVYEHKTKVGFKAAVAHIALICARATIGNAIRLYDAILARIKQHNAKVIKRKLDSSVRRQTCVPYEILGESSDKLILARVHSVRHWLRPHRRLVPFARIERLPYSESWVVMTPDSNRLVRNDNGHMVFDRSAAENVALQLEAGSIATAYSGYSREALYGTYWTFETSKSSNERIMWSRFALYQPGSSSSLTHFSVGFENLRYWAARHNPISRVPGSVFAEIEELTDNLNGALRLGYEQAISELLRAKGTIASQQ